jgi:hypothetical protein
VGSILKSKGDIVDTSIFTETAIPSASSIAAAKEKRTRIRKVPGAGMDEDFISLSLTRREDNVPAGPHPESRLVREEDELGEGDDGKLTWAVRACMLRLQTIFTDCRWWLL